MGNKRGRPDGVAETPSHDGRPFREKTRRVLNTVACRAKAILPQLIYAPVRQWRGANPRAKYQNSPEGDW
jgi:hypothetical protein